MRRVLIPLVTLSMLALGGCATNKRNDDLTTTLNAYASAVRWGDFNAALVFVDPKVREAHPISPLEMSRYQQYKVSGYDDGNGVVPNGQLEVKQTVKINLVNVNTQAERTVTDQQTWSYDAESKHWYLETGLPDISGKQL
jgi:hypothetical protein